MTSRNSRSSASGTTRNAGAYTTSAPRRPSNAPSSRARRSAVTPTVNPTRGDDSPTPASLIARPALVARRVGRVTRHSAPLTMPFRWGSRSGADYRLTDWISWTVMSWVVSKVPSGRSPPAPPVPSQLISQVMEALSWYGLSLARR